MKLLSRYFLVTFVLGCATGVPGEERVGVDVPRSPVDDVEEPSGLCADGPKAVVVSDQFTGVHDEDGALVTASVYEAGFEQGETAALFQIRTRYTSDQSWSFFDIAGTGNGDADGCRFCAFITLEDGTFLIGAEGRASDIDVDFEERVAGTLENMVFREVVSVGPGISEIVEDGCELTLNSISFDQATPPEPADP